MSSDGEEPNADKDGENNPLKNLSPDEGRALDDALKEGEAGVRGFPGKEFFACEASQGSKETEIGADEPLRRSSLYDSPPLSQPLPPLPKR